MEIKILIAYWIITTIIGAVFAAKNRMDRFDTQKLDEHYSLLDVVANLFPSAILSWAFIPVYLLSLIKFKK